MPRRLRRKPTIGFYGSCQAAAVRDMLGVFPEFRDKFNVVGIAEHLADEDRMQQFLSDEIPSVDVLIYQPISAAHRGELFSTLHVKSKLPPSSTSISFQYLHFESYNPFAFGSTCGLAIDIAYPDFLIGSLFMRGYRDKALETAYRQFALPYADAQSIHDACFRNFEFRYVNQDGGLDVQCTEFIRSRFRSERLFHTSNHPGAVLLNEVLKQIHSKLQVVFGRIELDSGSLALDPLSMFKQPTPPGLACSLGVQPKTDVRYDARDISLGEYCSLHESAFAGFAQDEIWSAIAARVDDRPWFSALL